MLTLCFLSMLLAGVVGLIILKFKVLKFFVKVALRILFIVFIFAGCIYLLSLVLPVFAAFL